jgi:hypothetical protein
MNFPHRFAVLSHVVPMLRIKHQPAADANRQIRIQPWRQIGLSPFLVLDPYARGSDAQDQTSAER